MLSVIMLNVIILNVIMMNLIMLNGIMMNLIMLNIIMMNLIMLNFIMLNVIMMNVANNPFWWVSLCRVSLCWVSRPLILALCLQIIKMAFLLMTFGHSFGKMLIDTKYRHHIIINPSHLTTNAPAKFNFENFFL